VPTLKQADDKHPEIVKVTEAGYLLSDSTRVSCPEADLSVEPDVLVLLVTTLESGRARLIPRAIVAEDRFIEIEGTVDLVVECISDSSVAKDKKRLRKAYWHAGVREYWIADVRGRAVELDVLVHRSQGYELAPKDSDGFAPSTVLGRHVRLTRRSRAAGLVFYGLDVR
jgi:Uma2 family endonuclease